MCPTIEFESKNVEQALQKASEELNIPADKLEHDVISHGSSGIFGLVGVRKAKIRVVIPDETFRQQPKKAFKKTKEVQAGVTPIVSETFEKSAPPDGADHKEPMMSAMISEDAAQIGKSFLETLVDGITSDAVVSVAKNGDKLLYNIVGGNTALLIGKRGQTLEALQYLVEKIVNKKNESRVRIQVDVEGYLDSRRERLETHALRLGDKVKRTGKPAIVGQFNAYERRIIHMVLKEDSEIRTHSVGEGYYRKLKIFPKRKKKGINFRVKEIPTRRP